MTTDHDANRLLMGSAGPPAARFDTIGDTASGTITALDTQQVRDFATGNPRTYPDGNPIMQIVATLNGDDGENFRIFFKPAIREAVRNAVTAAGADGLEVGGKLAVRYTSDEPVVSGTGFNPKKLYQAKYEPPAPAAVSVDDLF
jgi:hypothetical protein